MGKRYSREFLDEVVEQARAVHEAFNGERYWDRPRETTGPVDPHPGHHWQCRLRLGSSFGAAAMCTCARQKS